MYIEAHSKQASLQVSRGVSILQVGLHEYYKGSDRQGYMMLAKRHASHVVSVMVLIHNVHLLDKREAASSILYLVCLPNPLGRPN